MLSKVLIAVAVDAASQARVPMDGYNTIITATEPKKVVGDLDTSNLRISAGCGGASSRKRAPW